MATLTAAFLPAQRAAPEETRVTPELTAADVRLDQAVRLLAEHPDADTAALASTAHQLHGGAESTWRRLITQVRAELTDRHGLIKATGLSRATIERLWAGRDTNNHPPAVTVCGIMHWHPRHWQRWYAGMTADRTRQQHVDAGGINRDGDPDELVPWRELGRILGHKSGTTVAHWRAEPPAGPVGKFLRDEKPDGEILYRKVLQPAYRRARLWDLAAKVPVRGRGGAGRGAGRKAGAHPMAGELKLDLARRLISLHPDWTTADLIRAATAQTKDSPGPSAWRLIFDAARANPDA
ncbi:hypothetical protein ACFVVA_37000 [Kitasatospora sp. NPDC058048]|uniref:hypothetical protein n=1 Tax=Kitasatospora sp. NPDC058048 TaxID=3346313 RepID=UPI0036DBDE31